MPSCIQTALITGASSGIGEALAHLLADKGIHLILHGRNQQKLESLTSLFRKKNIQVDFITADLSSPSERKRVLDKILQCMPDLVINNAGFGLLGDALTFDTSRQLEILEVNGKAVLELTLETAKAFRTQGKKGIILNVSSAAGEVSIGPGLAVYAASKALVNHFSQSLDIELQPLGIRVLSACPGKVKTQFFKRAGQHQPVYEELMMTPQYAAEQIWKQIEKEKRLHVFDWKTRLLVAASKWIPKNCVAYIYRRYTQSE